MFRKLALSSLPLLLLGAAVPDAAGLRLSYDPAAFRPDLPGTPCLLSGSGFGRCGLQEEGGGASSAVLSADAPLLLPYRMSLLLAMDGELAGTPRP